MNLIGGIPSLSDNSLHVLIWFSVYLTPPSASTFFMWFLSGSPAIKTGFAGSTGVKFRKISFISLILPVNPGAKHFGSRAMKNWPRFASESAPLCVHFLTFVEKFEPARIPQRTSTIAPRPYPLKPEVISSPPRGARHADSKPTSAKIIEFKCEVQ